MMNQIATHLVLLVVVVVVLVGDIFKKVRDPFSNRIRMKFGRIIFRVNTHRLMSRIPRWRPLRHFTQKSAAAYSE